MTLRVYEVDLDHMDKPLDWRDRLLLASDPMTNDLGGMDADEATEALDYIKSLEETVKNIVHTVESSDG